MRISILGINCYDLIRVGKSQYRIDIGIDKNRHVRDLVYKNTNLNVLQDFLKRIKRK